MEWLINVIGIESGINIQTCKHLRRYKEREVLVDERWQWKGSRCKILDSMIKDRTPTNLNIRLNQRTWAQILKRPKMDPTRRRTTYPLYLAFSTWGRFRHSNRGWKCLSTCSKLVESWFWAVAIWPSWMRRLSRWVDTIEFREWVRR